MASLRDTTSRDCNSEPHRPDDTTEASRFVRDDGRLSPRTERHILTGHTACRRAVPSRAGLTDTVRKWSLVEL
jgi:hypothetical protein